MNQDTRPCQIWGGRLHKGYAVVGGDAARVWNTAKVSRILMSRLHNRVLEKTEWVCHTCDNPACVEITHLYLGDYKTNHADMVARGRSTAGRPLSAEHKEKLKEARARRGPTKQETRDKMSESQKVRWATIGLRAET